MESDKQQLQNNDKRLVLNTVLAVGSIFGGIWVIRRMMRSLAWRQRRAELLREYHERMTPSDAARRTMQAAFVKQMKDGLARAPESGGQHMMMLPTYVTQLPDGNETGDCYAVDIGGTNFRVMYLRLGTSKSEVLEQQVVNFSLSEELRQGHGSQLFDFIALQLSNFIRQHSKGSSAKDSAPPVVGFCFSFPCTQSALNKGILIEWTKGFLCEGVVGSDPVQLLAEAMERAGLPCNCVALLNDAVAVLAAGRYLDPDTEIAMILGTGTNACYVEEVSKVTKWQPDSVEANAQTMINIEWGAFNCPELPRIEEDVWADAATHHAGRYMFEKLVSGMYLGEVARRMLVRLCEETALFGSTTAPEALNTYGGFTSAMLATITDDQSPNLATTAEVLQDAFGLTPAQVSHSVCETVRTVCRLVARRSAKMVAMGVAAVLEQAGWYSSPRRVVIAVDGGVFEHFAGYRVMLSEELREEFGPCAEELHPRVQFRHFENASCVGGAVLAAAAAKTAAVAKGVPATDAAGAAVAAAALARDQPCEGQITGDHDSKGSNGTLEGTAKAAALVAEALNKLPPAASDSDVPVKMKA